MARHVGLERDAAGLKCALQTIAAVERAGNGEASLLNMTATAKLVTSAALVREESRGAHFRRDFPQTDGTAQRTFIKLTDAEEIARENEGQRSVAAR